MPDETFAPTDNLDPQTPTEDGVMGVTSADPILPTTTDTEGNPVVADAAGAPLLGTDGTPIAVSDAGVPTTEDPESGDTVVASPVTGEPVATEAGPVKVADDGTVAVVADPEGGHPVVADPANGNAPVVVDGETVPVAKPLDPTVGGGDTDSAPASDAATPSEGGEESGAESASEGEGAPEAAPAAGDAAPPVTDATGEALPVASPAQGNAGIGALPDPVALAGSVDASGGGSVDAVGTTVTGTPADNTGAGNVPGAPVEGAGGTGTVVPGVPVDTQVGDVSPAQPASPVQGIDPAGDAGIQVPANPEPADPLGQAGAGAASNAQPAPITNPVAGTGTELSGGVTAVANDPQDPATAGGLADGAISTDGPANVGGGAGVGTIEAPSEGDSGDSEGDSGEGEGESDSGDTAPEAPAAPAASDIEDILKSVQDQLTADFTAGVDSIEATLESTFAQMKTDLLDKLNAYNDKQIDRAEDDANAAIESSGFFGPLADALKDATDKYFGQTKVAAQAITAALPEKALQGFKASAATAIETLKHLNQMDLSAMSGVEKEMVDRLRNTMSAMGQHGLAFFHTKD